MKLFAFVLTPVIPLLATAIMDDNRRQTVTSLLTHGEHI